MYIYNYVYNTRPEQLEDCMPGVKNITLTNSPPSVTKLIYREIVHLNFILSSTTFPLQKVIWYHCLIFLQREIIWNPEWGIQ